MNNINLLKKFSLELGEKGSLSGSRFYDYIFELEGKNTLCSERLKIAKEENSSDWYKKILEK
jgi:hypothetical protein